MLFRLDYGPGGQANPRASITFFTIFITSSDPPCARFRSSIPRSWPAPAGFPGRRRGQPSQAAARLNQRRYRNKPPGQALCPASPFPCHGLSSCLKGNKQPFLNHLTANLSTIPAKAPPRARSSSSIVFRWEKLKRTTPCLVVPNALCTSGAQCAPGLV